MTFKNALCLDGMPENHDCRCKRRADHPGVHWHKFRDGRYRFWTDDSNESTITSTDAEAKELYRAVFPDWYGDDTGWAEEVYDEMRRVVNAPTLKKAADVIEWWGDWYEQGTTALETARKIRAKWNELHPERKVKP